MATRRSRKGTGTTSHLHRGKEGRQRMEREIAAAKKRRQEGGTFYPFRFYCKVDETREFVILDEEVDVFGYEHTLKNPKTGKWSETVTCVGENEICQACEEVGESTYVMYLSILDLQEYEDSRGNLVPFSRKLLVVKPTQQKKFVRVQEREGTLRGAIFEVSRDGPKDAAIGGDINFIEFMDEDELANDYIRTWTDRDGKEHTENCGEPFDYSKAIAPPDASAISAILGEHEKAGSTKSNKKVLEEEDEDEEGFSDDEEETPWEDDEEEKQEEKPRRGSRRGSSRGTRRSRRSEETDEEPKSSRRSTRSKRSSRREESAGSRRSSRRSTRSSRR